MALTTDHSVQLLAGAQTPTGAIPASTVHDIYQYGWLRDGSWCAYALDRAGRSDAAGRWHHVRRGIQVDDTLTAAAQLVVRYLLVAGETPCYDCWEEHPGNVHTSSLAVVAAGLRDAGALLGDQQAQNYAHDLVARITGPQHTLAEAFIRFPGDTRVDGSLLWLAVPFGIVDLDDPTYRNTVDRISDELVVPGGGVRRYLGDTFYGGSEWILLAATYGWVKLTQGDRATAEQMLAWIESAATDQGYLPEQVQDHVQSSHMLAHWRHKWGPTATPLLWSHAMHVVLTDEMNR